MQTAARSLLGGVLLVAASVTGARAAHAGPASPASPPRIHLRGSARLDAHAARAGGRLQLAGSVVDDAGRAIDGARVALTLSTSKGAVRAGSAGPSACSDGAAPPVVESEGTLVLPTDEAARFCVRLSLPTDAYVAHLESRGGALVDPARLDVPVDLALSPLTLRFDPEPGSVSLDDGPLNVEVVASTEDDGVTTAATGLPLALTNEAGAPLGVARTNASGRARFTVDGAQLGAPGHGELRVAFGGSSDAGATKRAVAIERRTRVDLVAPDAKEGRLPPGSPDDGLSIRVQAVPRCARLGCAGAPTGAVEIRANDTIVGAGSLERGEATVAATFAPPAGESTELVARYVPDAPWFSSGGELAIAQPLRAPSPWRKAPLALAGLLALAWLVIARWPPRRALQQPAGPAPRIARGEASLEVVRETSADEGWSGVVRDAHDGVGVAGARVAIERPTFDRVEVVAQTWSDASGTFRLPPARVSPGDELVAEGPVHTSLRRPLPGAGELEVSLVQRRRALLDRLVAWARRRGAPYDARPEPTPAHVRRAAATEFSVARWADAVERAAFGGQKVDAAVEGELRKLEPADEAREGEPEHVDGARRGSL